MKQYNRDNNRSRVHMAVFFQVCQSVNGTFHSQNVTQINMYLSVHRIKVTVMLMLETGKGLQERHSQGHRQD